MSRKGNYFSAWCLFCFIQFIHSYCKGKVLVLAIFLNVYNTSLNSRRFKSVPVQTNWILPWSRALEAELKPQKQLLFVLVLGQPLFGHDSHYRSVKLKVQGSTDGSSSDLCLLCCSVGSASEWGSESLVSCFSGSTCLRAPSGPTKHTRYLLACSLLSIFRDFLMSLDSLLDYNSAWTGSCVMSMLCV